METQTVTSILDYGDTRQLLHSLIMETVTSFLDYEDTNSYAIPEVWRHTQLRHSPIMETDVYLCNPLTAEIETFSETFDV
jgi:hypothetical protein